MNSNGVKKTEKLKVESIKEKIDLEDVQIQGGDPCKDRWRGIYDCLRDCAGSTPRGTVIY